MAAFMISYDLNTPGQDYKELLDAIRAYGVTWHCLDSTWIVIHPGPATAIRDNLVKHIDANDRLIVARLTGEAAWSPSGFSKECEDWLQNKINK